MKKSLLALILVLCLGFAMVFTSCGEETETFTNGRISIDLPLYFSDEDLEDGSVLFYTPVVGVKTYSLTESEFRAAYSYTGDSISLSTFANCSPRRQTLLFADLFQRVCFVNRAKSLTRKSRAER